MLEQVTFLLAVIGYAGLAAATVAAARGRLHPGFWRSVAAVIVLHVLLVWGVRYDWQFAQAVRNGYAGFVIFHAALAMICGSLAAPDPLARRLIVTAFAIVSAGAIGAVFRYDVVAIYRVPVLIAALGGTVGLIWARRPKR
jgi:hypothetical protein